MAPAAPCNQDPTESLGNVSMITRVSFVVSTSQCGALSDFAKANITTESISQRRGLSGLEYLNSINLHPQNVCLEIIDFIFPE